MQSAVTSIPRGVELHSTAMAAPHAAEAAMWTAPVLQRSRVQAQRVAAAAMSSAAAAHLIPASPNASKMAATAMHRGHCWQI